MQFKTFIQFSIFMFLFGSCQKLKIEEGRSLLIPLPAQHTFYNASFTFEQDLRITADDFFQVTPKFLEHFFLRNGSVRINESDNAPEIIFIKVDSIDHEEGYVLDVLPDQIQIHASTEKGAFYAVQSLRQLLPSLFENDHNEIHDVSIQCQRIEDEARFKYRGMHLDVGRHLFPVEFIKKYIDALAMLKMNTFHWHLTEDQGWRVEIKKYPKLNEIAAFRKETLIGHYSDQPHQFDGEHYGGFYTQEEIKEVVNYAEERHITVIPEIEMPGHSQAAIAAYPELGCREEQVEVATKWGVFEEIYCSKDETFDFLEDVLDEVLALFPSEFIHIGGDEAPKTRWENCNECQLRIKNEGLKDEHELQNYFISRIEKYLNSKGRQIIGWDEILEGGLAPNATVMSWRGLNGAIEAAKLGHRVIMSPTSHCYFDYYQSDNETEPLAIGGFLPMEKVYAFDPIPEELSEEESNYVLGAQGNVWTEYMKTSEQVEYMVFPRILAMSEVGWTNKEKKNYDDFVPRVEHFHKRLKALNINYANHLYEVEGHLESSEGTNNYHLETITEGKEIRYTLDGSSPTKNSRLYTSSIPIEKSTLIKAALFKSEKKLGHIFSERINVHKAVGKHITINKKAHKSYPGSGAKGLVNGISGSDSRYGDKEWLGFWGDDLEITIDLGKETEISTIETRFHNGNGQWIYAPKKMETRFDDDKDILFTKISTAGLIARTIIQFDSRKARYIRIKIPNYGVIPEGKQGAGNKAWTFIDEIIVN
ncbi:MAG: family 20 glycosylhydrolase [Bacteroidia bacterium]|nr:family 20 glycosylhydrolase [Bacteroidia bacterium]NND52017.1 family 20 glycosylhydrolase [Flavobacteriaceae bacterium]